MALMYGALFAGVAELPLTLNRWLQVPTLSAEVEKLRWSIRRYQLYRESLEHEVRKLRKENERLRFSEYDRLNARLPRHRPGIWFKI